MKKLAFILLSTLALSCAKQVIQPDTYQSLYDLEYVTTDSGYKYLVPVAHNSISEETVVSAVTGNGWETKGLYKLGTDKSVIQEVMVDENTISRVVFSDDGSKVSTYSLSIKGYETAPFTYHSGDNIIEIPSLWYSSWGGNGRLVSISSSTMVIVCTHDKTTTGEELVFMEILSRVPESTVDSWKETCVYYGLSE